VQFELGAVRVGLLELVREVSPQNLVEKAQGFGGIIVAHRACEKQKSVVVERDGDTCRPCPGEFRKPGNAAAATSNTYAGIAARTSNHRIGTGACDLAEPAEHLQHRGYVLLGSAKAKWKIPAQMRQLCELCRKTL